MAVRHGNALSKGGPGTTFAALARMPHFRKLAFASLCAFVANTASAGNVSALFVGNSLTQVNDLPAVFKSFVAASDLHVDVDVYSVTPGGAFLSDHWKRGQAVTVLRAQHPNFLILQGQSVEPLLAPKDFAYYARLFKTEADQLQAKTCLFSTWARPDGDAYYKDLSSGGSSTEMQMRLNSCYASVAQDISASLAPIGLAWQRAHEVAPQIQLLDGTQHPSPAGTYLAAAVLFRTLFNASPIGSAYYSILPPTTAHTLQRIADSVPLQPTR
jgi:hypothetical protein